MSVQFARKVTKFGVPLPHQLISALQVTYASIYDTDYDNTCFCFTAGDIHRPHLNPRPDYESDYVNAVYVDVSTTFVAKFFNDLRHAHLHVHLYG